MKYCRLQTESGPQYAEVKERSINGTKELWIERLVPPFVEGPASDLVDPTAPPFAPLPLLAATLLAPVAPSKIVCIGRNYRDHAAELGNPVPLEPLLFLKPPSSLLAPLQAIRIPGLSQRVDFEGELAVVIGTQCSRIGPDEDPAITSAATPWPMT